MATVIECIEKMAALARCHNGNLYDTPKGKMEWTGTGWRYPVKKP